MLSTATDIHRWQFENQELADPELIDKLVISLCDSCDIGFPHFKLHLLVTELLSNAIDHGVLSLSSHFKDSREGFESYLMERSMRLDNLRSGRIEVTTEILAGSLLRLSVRDSGSGFNFDDYSDNTPLFPDDCLLQLHGRGLAIIKNLCESVQYLDGGSCTVVEFNIAAA